MKTRTSNSRRAMTLPEAMLVAAVLGLLIGFVLLPRLARPRSSKRITCVNSLKQVGLAFRIWCGDHGDRFPMMVSTNEGGTMEWTASGKAFPHFQVMSNELNTPKILVCPADRSRTAATNFAVGLDDSHVSYFVELDADENQPQTILAGDSNLEVAGKSVRPGLLYLWTNSAVGWTAERHVQQGNICFSDGSVQQYGNTRFQQQLSLTGVATNRLAIP